MKKIVFLLTLIFTVLIGVCTAHAYNTDVYIDGVIVNFDSQTGFPFVQNGRTMVPLRQTMESFGATVDWEDDTQTAIVRMDTTTVLCKIGEYSIYRNNVKIPNDAAAVEVGGRTYLPIRVVLESFGAKVDWDGSVRVTSSGGTQLIYQVENSPSVTTNYWGIWNDALAQKQYGNYQLAIDKILSVSNVFLKDNDSASCAMLYKHLGECYSELGSFDYASQCFKREAFYWGITPGMNESKIDATRRAGLIAASTQLYVKSTDPDMGAKKYFGQKHEPMGGIYLGAYAEGDTNIHDPWNPSKFYMDTFPTLAGRDMAAYLLYLPYGMDASVYETHFQYAIKNNKLMQIALEPRGGLAEVIYEDPYLINLAKYMENHDCNFILRFGGEMNDPTSMWFDSPDVFIQKFRIVADVFHKYAPSVPVVWAPNFYPPDTIDDYYPGDEYVDYVGMSSYQMHTAVTDPLGKGVDRSRWSNQLDTIYSLYGHKKPIIIVEGGASCMDYDTWVDITSYAAWQIKDFYTYLPIKYPNVKMCFLFSADRERQKFALSNYPEYCRSYNEVIKSDLFLSSFSDDGYKYDYYELGNNVSLKSEPTELCSYVTNPENNTAYVIYYINGTPCGTSYGAPYSINVDFTPYANTQISINVKSFNANHMPVSDYTVTVNVK